MLPMMAVMFRPLLTAIPTRQKPIPGPMDLVWACAAWGIVIAVVLWGAFMFYGLASLIALLPIR